MRVVCALPYALDRSPGQRFRWEQWAPGLRRHGVDIDLLPFSTMEIEAARAAGITTSAIVQVLSRWPVWAMRFTRSEVKRMVEDAGLVNIRFSERPPYWCAVGFRK